MSTPARVVLIGTPDQAGPDALGRTCGVEGGAMTIRPRHEPLGEARFRSVILDDPNSEGAGDLVSERDGVFAKGWLKNNFAGWLCRRRERVVPGREGIVRL